MKTRAILAVLSTAALLLPVGTASAQETVTADLAPVATLVGSGEAADIEVTVSCPKKHEVLEAFVYITQDGYTSRFAGIPVPKCKGRPVTLTVRVPASGEAPFHPGEASASSYVLVQTPDQSGTISGGEFQPITIV